MGSSQGRELDAAQVRVVIVNFNAGDYLAAAVDSVRRAHSKLSIVVVDNASTDQSLAQLDRNDTELKIIRLGKNAGFGSACNRGAADAPEPWLLFLNPDCVLRDQVLERMLALGNRRQICGLVGARVVGPDGTPQRAWLRSLPTTTRASLGAIRGTGLDRPEKPSAPVRVEAVSGAAMLVRREAFEQVGGFDQAFFLHCEDLDLFARLQGAGWELWLEPRASIEHRQGVSQSSRPLRSHVAKYRSMARYYDKHLRKGALTATFWKTLLFAHFLLRLPFHLIPGRA